MSGRAISSLVSVLTMLQTITNDYKTVHIRILSADYPLGCKLTDIGTEYMGTQHVTESDVGCMKWQDKSILDGWTFPDDSPGDAGSNCRNVDEEPNGPWCYLADGSNANFGYCKQISHCCECIIQSLLF